MGKVFYQKIGASLNRDNSCEFRVWAPYAREVMLCFVEESRSNIKMIKMEYGYWYARVEDCMEATRYLFKPDGKGPFPDPASRYQPEGVHGPSEVKDFTSFKWSDHLWENIPLGNMIFYELHTGIFSGGGGFKDIISRLDYFQELGINTIQLMPVGQFPGKRNWGYDGVYPFSVQQSYGGPYELMKLVDACHNKRLAVVLDVVYNHLGPEGNYFGEYAPYFTSRYNTPWGNAINYDDSYAYGVRNFVVQNVTMWLEDFHLDGLRLDAVHAIYDFSARHIMQELSETVEEINHRTGRAHYLIAESGLNDSRYINKIQSGGYGLDAQWNDDYHHGIHTLVTGEKNGYYVDFTDPEMFTKAYCNGFAYDGEYSVYRKRVFGNSSKNNQGQQFVVYSQNHDQVGNRKLGERLSSLVSFETLKLIAGTVFLSPYLPMLFMGEEYGEKKPFLYFVNHNDRELNRLVREGREQEFESFFSGNSISSPDPSEEESFLKCKLSGNPFSDGFSKTLFEYYKYLIQLKKEHPVISRNNKNDMQVKYDNRIFTIERWHGKIRFIAWLNFGSQPVTMRLPGTFVEKASLLLNSSDKRWGGAGIQVPDSLSANDAAIVRNETMLLYSNQ